MKLQHLYSVYILLCADKSYYTGITNDLDRRFEEHNTGIDPKCYTFSRRPLILKHYEQYQNINEALSREKQIKKWSRKKKEALIKDDFEELKKLAKNKVNRNEVL